MWPRAAPSPRQVPVLLLAPGAPRLPPPSPLSCPRYRNCSGNFPPFWVPAPPLPSRSTASYITSTQVVPPRVRPPPAAGLGETPHRRRGVPRLGKSRYYPLLKLAMGVPAAPGPKEGWGWRPCSDYRRLSAVTILDRYPLPNMQSLNDRIAEEDIQKTAIATPFDLWEFLFMAFGLRNAAQALQRLKDNILMGLDYVFSFFR
jgi:hypothetical protein